MSMSDAIGPMTVISTEGAPKSRTERSLRWIWHLLMLLLTLLIVALAWFVAAGQLYKPGSSTAYNLGLAGGVMLLILLLYPLHKRVRGLQALGSAVFWFRIHIVLGTAAPVLILFHSMFNVSSMNARVAFYSMLMVVLSGFVGRFFYRHLHHGLYGRELTLADTRAELGESARNLTSLYALRGDFESRLAKFHDQAFTPTGNPLRSAFRFATLKWRSGRLGKAIRHDLKIALRKLGKEKKMTRADIVRNYEAMKLKVDSYLDAVVSASQFLVWERLFSYWHLFHLPFLYLLVISGIVHVVAVHMY